MKKRLKEMEEEAAALREMQAKVEKEMGAVQGILRSIQGFDSLIVSSFYHLESICLICVRFLGLF